MLSSTLKKLDAFKFDRVAESDNTAASLPSGSGLVFNLIIPINNIQSHY